MTALTWHGREYWVDSTTFADDGLYVSADGRRAILPDTASALGWLTSHGLRKGKARKLVADELRRVGCLS